VDEFKFAIYDSRIEALKGSKGPLKKIINEVFEITSNFKYSNTIEVQVYGLKLVGKAIKYSSLVRPLTKDQESTLKNTLEKVIKSYELSPEEVSELIKNLHCGYIYIYPETIKRYRLAVEYKKALKDTATDLHVSASSLSITYYCDSNILALPTNIQFKGTEATDAEKAKIPAELKKIEEAINELTQIKEQLNEYINSADVE